jgi:hypothetical protein
VTLFEGGSEEIEKYLRVEGRGIVELGRSTSEHSPDLLRLASLQAHVVAENLGKDLLCKSDPEIEVR